MDISASAIAALVRLADAPDPDRALVALGEVRRELGDGPLVDPLLAVLLRRVDETHRLRREATEDGLTGLTNRATFDAAIARELARFARGGMPPALILLDLDGLKELNDRFGHAFGDEAIVTCAEALATGVRATDLPGRLGGDEFGVLLPATSEQGAYVVARRLRSSIEARCVAGRPLRVSIGLAVPDEAAVDLAELKALADERLYSDKRGRRLVGFPSVAA